MSTAFEGVSVETLAELSGHFASSLTPPGHMPIDQARAYMAKIVNLFGAEEIKVSLAVAAWAALHDVGSVQDFSGKPPIVCGTISKPAIKVFGEIVPVTGAGEPRQFCATMFEEHVDTILKVFPQLGPMLAARCAEAGLPVSDPKAVISWVKGVTPNTAGGGTVRMKAKSNLLLRNAQGARPTGAAAVSEIAVGRVIEDVGNAGSGHNLY